MSTKTVEEYGLILNTLVTQQLLFLMGDGFFDHVGLSEKEIRSSSNVVALLKEREIPDFYINLLLIKGISSVAEQYINDSNREAYAGFFGAKRKHTDLMRELKVIDAVLPLMKDAKMSEMDIILAESIQSIKNNLVRGVLRDGCKSHGNFANICRAITHVTGWDFPKEFTERLGIEDTSPIASPIATSAF